jgi:aspartate racemase
MKPILGVMGGMGALASAEFVKTVYEYNADREEQLSPTVVLYSDPAFPDRTDSFLKGTGDVVAGLLTQRLEELDEMNVTRVVLCCVTLHYTLPKIPRHLRSGIISLVGVALDQVIESKRRQLLLCSSGARASRVFEDHEKWPLARKYISLPDRDDQEMIHRALYRYKVAPASRPLIPRLKGLLLKYGADSFIAGCSELHMMTKQLMSEGDQYHFVDPLLTIAMNLSRFLALAPAGELELARVG